MSNRENNTEQSSNENLLYQRLMIFLIVFSVLIIGALNTQRKILFLSVLALGVIICWVLTLIIIRTAKGIDKKSGGRIIRLLLGYLVPIFCSLLLTMTLVVGSLGFVDPYLFNVEIKPVQLENKIDELKNKIKDQLKPKEVKTTQNFKSIDSVINNDSLIRAREKNLLRSGTNKKNDSKYFKGIDKVIR